MLKICLSALLSSLIPLWAALAADDRIFLSSFRLCKTGQQELVEALRRPRRTTNSFFGGESWNQKMFNRPRWRSEPVTCTHVFHTWSRGSHACVTADALENISHRCTAGHSSPHYSCRKQDRLSVYTCNTCTRGLVHTSPFLKYPPPPLRHTLVSKNKKGRCHIMWAGVRPLENALEGRRFPNGPSH